jgi:uncharacterized protein (UPF0262 family)
MLTAMTLTPFSSVEASEQEQKIVIHDILNDNIFDLVNAPSGESYSLDLCFDAQDVIFKVQSTDQTPVTVHSFALSELETALEDYALICESYKNAVRTLPSEQIETIDMGRRGIHNQGAEELQDCLKDHILIDQETARRFFTLISLYKNDK